MDWTICVTIASIIGTIANVYKKKWCFYIWLATNTTWCIYDFTIKAYSQSILMLVYAGISIWGIIQWRTGHNISKDIGNAD